MQIKQVKTHTPKPATKTTEPAQKVVSSGAPTRTPAWTSAWGDHPPVELFPDSEVAIQRQVATPDRTNADNGHQKNNGNYSGDQAATSARQGLNPDIPSVQTIPPVIQEALNSPGQPMNAALRTQMESHFGHNFSGVQVHADTKAAESARKLNAEAFTISQHIFFGADRYQPNRVQGQHLLAHELTHTVQQESSPVSQNRVQPRYIVSRPGEPLEQEAEFTASQVVTGRPLSLGAISSVKSGPYSLIARQPAGVLPSPPQVEELEATEQVESITQEILRKLQLDPEDRSGEVRRQLTTLNPATLKAVLGRVRAVIPPFYWKRLTESLAAPISSEGEERQSTPKPSASTSPTGPSELDTAMERKETTRQETLSGTASPSEPGPEVSPETTTEAVTEQATSETESMPGTPAKAVPEMQPVLPTPTAEKAEIQIGQATPEAGTTLEATAKEAATVAQEARVIPQDQTKTGVPTAPASTTSTTRASIVPTAAEAAEPVATLVGATQEGTSPTGETGAAQAEEVPAEAPGTEEGETIPPEMTTEPSTPESATVPAGAATEAETSTEATGEAAEAEAPTDQGSEIPLPEAAEPAGEASTPETPTEPEPETALPAPTEEPTGRTPTAESAPTIETRVPETATEPTGEATTTEAPVESAPTPEPAASGATMVAGSETATPVTPTSETATSAVGEASAQPTTATRGTTAEEAPSAETTTSADTADLEASAESSEGEATDVPAGDAKLEPSEREAMLASIAETPVSKEAVASGGGEVATGSGEGGKPITEPPAPQVPDVSQAQPAQALAQVSNLPPAQLQAALGGVSAATSRSVNEQRAELAASPPQMERPSGAPASATAEGEQGVKSAQMEAASGKPTKQKVSKTPHARGTGKGTAGLASLSRPLPPAPASPVAAVPAPKITGDAQGQVSAAEAQQLKTALRRLPTTDPGLEVTAEPPPKMVLEGEANPENVQAQQLQLERDVSQAHQQGKQDVAQPMGENEIYPDVPKETLRAEIPTSGGASGASAKASTGGTPQAAGTPAAQGEVSDEDAAASIIAQEQKGEEIRAAAAQAQSGMAERGQEHATQVTQERADSQRKIDEMVTQNTQDQEKQRTDAQSEAQQQREQWSGAQDTLVESNRSEAEQQAKDGMQVISNEQEKGEKEAAEHIQEGNRKAEDERGKAEADAADQHKSAEKESDGVWGWVSSKVGDFFARIKQGIQKVFDEARKAIRGFIEKAKQLATQAIEAAQKVIVDKIRQVGDALIAIGDKVLADFPGLRDKFRQTIQKGVAVATVVVNKLADQLKKDVQKALDVLGKGLDAALGMLEKGLQAAVDGLNQVVQGAIKFAKGVAEAIGVFATLIKDIASHPLQWLSNLGAAAKDGIRNHLWQAFKEAVTEWFNQKVEEVLGLGLMIWNLLKQGGISLKEIGTMAWEAIKEAIPAALIQILIEKLVSMIVPAAGAIMAIIEGLQAAWGTIKRIIAAIQAFVEFLKAVKTGNAGPQFAKMLAAAAIAVMDFVANWLLKRLRKPASPVGGRIRAIAQRIAAGLKKVGKGIVKAVKAVGKALVKAGKAAWRGIKKAGKYIGKKILQGAKWVLKKMGKAGKKIEQGLKWVDKKIKAGVKKVKDWWKKRRGTKEERQQRALETASATLDKLVTKGASLLRIRLTATYLRFRYLFKTMQIAVSDDTITVSAGFSPWKQLTKAQRKDINKAKEEYKNLPGAIDAVAVRILYETKETIDDLIEAPQKTQLEGIITAGLRASGRPYSPRDVEVLLEHILTSKITVITGTSALRKVYRKMYEDVFGPANVAIHHLMPLYLGGTHEPVNLLELRPRFHRQVHALFESIRLRKGLTLSHAKLRAEFAGGERWAIAVIYENGHIGYEEVKFSKGGK